MTHKQEAGMLRSRVVSGCIVSSVIGIALIALPDAGRRVFSISGTHGPAAVDLVGAVVLAAGWLALQISIARQWRRLTQQVGRSRMILGVVTLVLGFALLAAMITSDREWWWWLPAGLLASAPQIAAASVLARSPSAGISRGQVGTAS